MMPFVLSLYQIIGGANVLSAINVTSLMFPLTALITK